MGFYSSLEQNHAYNAINFSKRYIYYIYFLKYANVHFDLNNELSYEDIPKLSKGESNCLEGEITLAEASNTLCNMKSNKSPGSDGFSSEYFKVFKKIY